MFESFIIATYRRFSRLRTKNTYFLWKNIFDIMVTKLRANRQCILLQYDFYIPHIKNSCTLKKRYQYDMPQGDECITTSSRQGIVQSALAYAS